MSAHSDQQPFRTFDDRDFDPPSPTGVWHAAINDKQRGVDWQFQVGDARVKLESLDPKLIV